MSPIELILWLVTVHDVAKIHVNTNSSAWQKVEKKALGMGIGTNKLKLYRVLPIIGPLPKKSPPQFFERIEMFFGFLPLLHTPVILLIWVYFQYLCLKMDQNWEILKDFEPYSTLSTLLSCVSWGWKWNFMDAWPQDSPYENVFAHQVEHGIRVINLRNLTNDNKNTLYNYLFIFWFFLFRESFGSGGWPSSSPQAQVYDISNTSAKMVILNDTSRPKVHVAMATSQQLSCEVHSLLQRK